MNWGAFLFFFFSSLSLVFRSCFSLASRSLVIIVEHHDNERMHYRGSTFFLLLLSPPAGQREDMRFFLGMDGWMDGLGWRHGLGRLGRMDTITH